MDWTREGIDVCVCVCVCEYRAVFEKGDGMGEEHSFGKGFKAFIASTSTLLVRSKPVAVCLSVEYQICSV